MRGDDPLLMEAEQVLGAGGGAPASDPLLDEAAKVLFGEQPQQDDIEGDVTPAEFTQLFEGPSVGAGIGLPGGEMMPAILPRGPKGVEDPQKRLRLAYENALNAPPDKSDGARIRELIKYAPFAAGIAATADNLAVGAAATRLTQHPEQADDRDVEMVAQYLADRKKAGDRTMLQQVGEILARLPAFGIEFAATGGLFSAGKAATGKALGTAAETVAGKAAAGLVGAAAQTAAMPLLGESITRRTIPNIQYIEPEIGSGQAGMFVAKPGEKVTTAMVRGSIDALTEVASERLGGHLIRLPGFKQFQESLVRHMPEMFAREASENAISKLTRDVFKDVGYDGPIPEFLEERLGDIVRSLTGVQPLEDAIPSLEQSIVELTAFSVPHAGHVAISRIGEARDDAERGAIHRAMNDLDQFVKEHGSPESPTPPQGSPAEAPAPAAAPPSVPPGRPSDKKSEGTDWPAVTADPAWVEKFVRDNSIKASDLPAAMTQSEFARLTGGSKRALNAEQRQKFLDLLRQHAAAEPAPSEAPPTTVDVDSLSDEEVDAAIDEAEAEESKPVTPPSSPDVPAVDAAGSMEEGNNVEPVATENTPTDAAPPVRTADGAAPTSEATPPAGVPKFNVGDRVEYMDGGKRVTGTIENVGTWNASISRDDSHTTIPILHSVPVSALRPIMDTIPAEPPAPPASSEEPANGEKATKPSEPGPGPSADQSPVLADDAGQPGGAVPAGVGGDATGGDIAQAPRRGGGKNHRPGGAAQVKKPAAGGVGAEGDRPSGVDRAGEPEPGGSGAESGGQEDAPRISQNRGRNHVIDPEDEIVPRGDVGKVEANVRAIEILHNLQAEGRAATAAEKKEMAKFVGWGALSQAFDDWKGQAMLDNRPYGRDENWEKKWGKAYRRIRDVMTEDERRAAKASTLNAHYTSREIIGKMWSIARRLGFRGGTVLEPASGIGHFVGMMPADLAEKSNAVMVELDTLSANLAAALYPRAQMFATGLESVDLPPNSVDLAITNVPFHQVGPADARQRYGVAMNLHNYFFARMIDAVRPGGLVIAISTHHTMDSQVQQRAVLADRAELIGAIRLPRTAFEENAGTEVVTDIVILRKPADGVIRGETWKRTGKITTIEGKEADINEYFVERPDMVLGQQSMSGKMRARGKDELEYTVLPDASKPLGEQLDAAVASLPENLTGGNAAPAFDFSQLNAASGLKEGTLVERDGQLAIVGEKGKFIPAAEVEPWLLTPKGAKQAKVFIGLRDHYAAHLALMGSDDATDDQVSESRRRLNTLYDAAVDKYKKLNAGTNWKNFDFDPGYYLVAGMEREVRRIENGKIKKEWAKSAVFEKRTIMPSRPPASAESVKDALRISLSYRGRIDSEYIGQLVGKDQDAAEAELVTAGLAWRDPKSGLLQTSEEYLSGNVRQKLYEARQAAKADPRYQPNVDALEAIQPPPVSAKNISMRLGGAWIPSDVVQEWARKILGANGEIKYVHAADSWSVTGFPATPENFETWATERYAGHQLVDHALNLQQPLVYDTEPDPDNPGKTRRVFNHKETVAAKAMIDRLRESFRAHVEASPTAMESMEKAYNEAFNFWVEAKYDGGHLDLPGMSQAFKLRPYQKNVIWRLLQRGRGLLAHAVGAGKTLVMISTAMEMRRLGLAKKPMVVVLNATLTQFAATWRQAYPQANLLIATKRDLEAKNRKKFMARVAAGDYDAVVVAQSSFDLLPVDPKRSTTWINEQLDELDTIIAEAAAQEGKKSPTVKELEGRKKKLNEMLKKLQGKAESRQDDVLTFEQLGVDALFVDEAHAYKKPPFITKLKRLIGLNVEPSQRAFNVMMKLRHVQENNRGRNVVLATGTPVTNTLGEAWHMMNMVDPEVLKEFNVETFDRFVTAFSAIESTMTQTAGGQFKNKDGLPRFYNGFQLTQFIRSSWDVITTPQLHELLGTLGADLPKIKGGKPESVIVPLSAPVERFTDYLKRVYAKFEGLRGKEKRFFSYIPIVTFGAARAAAIDIRLVDPAAKDDPGSKVNRCVEGVMERWKDNAANRSTQLVFLDSMNKVSTEKLRQFLANEDVELEIDESEEEEDEDLFLYRDMTRKLVARGVPAEEIAVINDYDTDAKRAVLFDKVNAGDIRIVMGSSKKLGTGVNVQTKLITVHHLDAPWLPADLEQRNGRILRSGNENPEIEIVNYSMAETLDAAILLALVRKSRMIEQVLSGKAGAEFDDPAGLLTLSAAEQLAAMSGDPRMQERLELEARVRDLAFEAEAHADSNARRRSDRRNLVDKVERLTKQAIPRLEKTAAFIDAQPADLVATLDGKDYKGEAGQAKLTEAIDKIIAEKKPKWLNDTTKGILPQWDGRVPAPAETRIFQGTINGLDVSFHVGGFNPAGEWRLRNALSVRHEGTELYFGSAETGDGIIKAATTRGPSVERSITELRKEATDATARIAEIDKLLTAPFAKKDQLDKARGRLNEINQQLVDEGRSATERATEEADRGPEEQPPLHSGIPLPLPRRPLRPNATATPDVVGTNGLKEGQAERLQRANGVGREPLLQRIIAYPLWMWRAATRTNIHIPRTTQWMPALEIFRKLRDIPGWAQHEAVRRVGAILDPMGPALKPYFNSKLLAANILASMERGEPARMGFDTVEDVERWQEAIDAEIAALPMESQLAIAKALDTRQAIVREMVQELVAAKLLPASTLDRADSYFHQQVLLYARGERVADRIGGKQISKAPFQRQRVAGRDLSGEEYDYNTEYVEAETRWMSHALAQLSKKQALGSLDKNYGKLKEFKRTAARRNWVNFVGGPAIAKQVEGLKAMWEEAAQSGADASELAKIATQIEALDPTWALSRRIGRLSARLRKRHPEAPGGEDFDPDTLGEDGDEGAAWFQWLRGVIEADPDSADGITARGIFKAIDTRRKMYADKLGEKLANWRTILHETPGYEAWQPRPGNHFYQAFTLPEEIASQVQQGLLDMADVPADVIRTVVALGQARESYVLPLELVTALEDTRSEAPTGALGKIAKKIINAIKQIYLFSPARVVGYSVRNAAGDSEMAIAGGGMKMFKHVPRAWRELWRAGQGYLSESREMRAAREWGVIGSGLTAREWDDIRKHPAVRRFFEDASKEPAIWKKAFTIPTALLHLGRELNSLRESAMRYAAFLHYLEEAKNPTPFAHAGGSFRQWAREIQRNLGQDAAAAHLARNLLGDYSDITVLGRAIRDYALPFWSFTETVFTRVPRFIYNAVEYGRIAGKGNFWATQAYRGLALLSIGALYAATWAWNHLVMPPDDEEALSPSEQAVPHMNFGRNADGQVRVLRNISAFGEFADWFGFTQLAELYPKYAAGQIKGHDIAKAMMVRPVEKFANMLGPHLKGVAETLTGTSWFPDPLNPRSQPRDEAATSALGLRDEYLALRGWLARDGTRPAKGYWSKMMTGTVLVQAEQAALSEIHGLRDSFLESKGKGRPRVFGQSKYRAMRAAGYNDDYDAFAQAMRVFTANGGKFEEFRQHLASLDPVENKLNPAWEKEFVESYLTGQQRRKLDVARRYANDLEAKLTNWWLRAATPDQRAEAMRAIKKRREHDRQVLNAPPPTWRTGQTKGEFKERQLERADQRENARRRLSQKIAPPD